MTTNCADVTGSGKHPLDIWHVRLANGETRALSLDELDKAFDEGWVNERTLVLKAGAIRWLPLGEIAGLDESPEPPPSESVPHSIAPLALDVESDFEVRLDDLRTDDALADLSSEPSETFLTNRKSGRGARVAKVLGAVAVLGVLAGVGFTQRPRIAHAVANAKGVTTSVDAKAKAEAKTKAEADARAKAEADARAKVDAEAKAKAKADADARAKAEADAKAVPTMSLGSLPNADDKKGKKTIKTAPKRR